MQEAEGEARAGQRGSRLSKWSESTADARKNTKLNYPEKLKNLGSIEPVKLRQLLEVGQGSRAEPTVLVFLCVVLCGCV